MALLSVLQATWLAQRGSLFIWIPVCLAFGIGTYFSLSTEPDWPLYFVVTILALLAFGFGWRCPGAFAPLFWGIIVVALGFCLAGARAHFVGHSVLGWHYYGPIEGRIVGIDRSASDALRLTLDQVRLDRLSPSATPTRVRLSLHGRQGFFTPQPGSYVMTTGHLSPPSGPVEPGGFDFQRHSWFLRLGAVGYTRTPVLTRAPSAGDQRIFSARMWVSDRIQTALPGQTGAFTAAISTGDRSALDQEALDALRVTNLAHLLAISGLHMGLLAGFVFASLRFAMAAVPRIGLRVSGKKIAAVGALVVAAGYLVLSGASVATERAFVMVAVALIAVLFDRRAFSLRAVALAAVIVLFLRPEALLSPGFQMSFAATSALVVVFNWIRDYNIPSGPLWVRPFSAVFLSSLIAGLATAPIAAAHFNQFAHFGLIANLLSVPVMGLIVMPSIVISSLFLPFGWESIPLWFTGHGVNWILGIADWIAGFPSARGTVKSPMPGVLPLISIGGVFVAVWIGWGKLFGLIPLSLGFVLWNLTDRPAVLISDSGGLVGVMTSEGRALNRARGSGFVAKNWLENDGDAATQEQAAQRWALLADHARSIRTFAGKRAVNGFKTCDRSELIVLSIDPPQDISAELPCRIFSPRRLLQTGAVAIFETSEGEEMRTARQQSGARLWNTQTEFERTNMFE